MPAFARLLARVRVHGAQLRRVHMRRPGRSALVYWGALAMLAGCQTAPEELVLSGPTMGTTYTVKIAAAPDADAHAVRSIVDEVLAQIDVQMSGYRTDSEIARFNAQRSTEWFPVSENVARVAAAAQEVARRSRGAFDVTVAPLVDLWGFGPGGRSTGQAPEAARIDELAARVGRDKLHVRIEPPALRKEVPELAVDLNSIAPGFAVDLLAARLAAAGFEHFMVDIGGEIRVHGRNARGTPWRIAIERPDLEQPVPYAILELDGMAVATSGGYRRFQELEGRRYSHAIDPLTGRPVPERVAAVVVVQPTAMLADAWATALLVRGVPEGRALAEREGIAALFILREGARLVPLVTADMAQYFVVEPSETAGGDPGEGS